MKMNRTILKMVCRAVRYLHRNQNKMKGHFGGAGLIICMLLWFGTPSPTLGQTEEVKDLLKQIEKLETKQAQPRSRPAAGIPEEVVEEEATPVETISMATGILDSTAFPKLSDAEQRLLISYENFVSLFPEHERVPELLYNAGARYFAIELYPNARIVYERILDNHPSSGEWYINSLADIVESYRRENDFQNLEVWSERLRTDPNAPDSLKNAGERLAAGAIANQALEQEKLADASGDEAALAAAAETYIRTARTYPDAEFATTSLFRAGNTYKKANMLDKAAEVWLDLVARYPEVSYADTAMWNAALAYDELEQYDLALKVYEQFIGQFPASLFRIDALKNSIYDYTEMENYHRTAEAYEQYATEFVEDAGAARSYYVAQAWLKAKEVDRAAAAFDRFATEDPTNEKMNEVQFELGQAWIKQGNLESANLSFARFARQNPDNPLSVKIQYDVGEYYYGLDDLIQARSQFEETIRVSDNMESKGLDGNAYYRAEAYIRLADMTYPDFEAIRLTLPKATLDANLERKKEMGRILAGYYDGVILSGSIRGAEAAYKKSELFEQMANVWLTQEQPPPEKEALKRALQLRELNDGATAFLEQAIIPLVAVHIHRGEEYADITFDTTWTATRDSILSITKVDSSTSEWVVKGKRKIIEHSLMIAELHTEDDRLMVETFYDYFPVPIPGKEIIDQIGKEAAEFLFSSFAYTAGIDTLGANILRDAIPAYQHVVDLQKPEPDGYSLTGPEITQAQQHALNLAIGPVRMNESRIAPMMDDYDELSVHWMQLTDSLMYRPENIRDVFDFGDLLYGILDNGLLSMYVDESLKIGRDMSFRYENVIMKAAEMGIAPALVDTLKIHMVKFYYDLGARYFQSAQFAEITTDRYFDRMAQIDSIMAEGEGLLADKLTEADASTVLNDMVSTGWDEMNFSLRNAALEIYEAGYGYQDIYPVADEWYSKIRQNLTALDPQLYPPPSVDYNIELTSDDSWEVSNMASGDGWMMTEFVADSTWQSATVGTYPVFMSTLPGLEQSRSMPVWTAPDTAGVADSLIYARKEFMVFGQPDAPTVTVASTAPYEVFINGLSTGKADQVDPNMPQSFDLTGWLMEASRNVIAIIVQGNSTEQHSVIVELSGMDSVPETAENLETARLYYSLPSGQRTLPD